MKMAEPRPKINIELTAFDRKVEGFALAILILMWIGTMVFFERLPEVIPSHFSLSGKADGFRDKTSIFFLPLIATIIYIGMTLINRHPHLYNYLSPVTSENAQGIYTSATRMIRVLKLIIIVIMSGVVTMIIKTALGNS
jgi:uncharacterized membrane protein